MVTSNEVFLKTEHTVFGVKDGGERVVGHGKKSHFHVPALAQLLGHLGLGNALGQSLTAVEVRGEVPVAQTKPRFAIEGVEFVHHSPRFTAQSPSQLVVVETRKGVRDGVEVWTDGESVQYEIVANIYDGAKFAGVYFDTERA
jgi:hypothetical protein